MSSLLGWAAWGQVGDQRSAQISTSAAAVFEQKQRDLAEAIEVCAIDDGAAFSLATYQFRAGKNGEVRRHRVLGDFNKTSEFAGGHSFRLAGDEKTECLEPRRLGERRQCGYGFDVIHISSLPDRLMLARRLGDGGDARRGVRRAGGHARRFSWSENWNYENTHPLFQALMHPPHDVGGQPDVPVYYEEKEEEQWELNTYVTCEVLG
jgi:hypothetical protein